jgi:hypothetical protein
MWSHYADSGRGFCIEFCTDTELFAKANPVRYVDSFPEINLAEYLAEGQSDFIRFFQTKSSYWAYEKEWRVLKKDGIAHVFYEPDQIKAVYFGSEADWQSIAVVLAIVTRLHPGAEFYKGRRDPTEFRMDFQLAEVTDPTRGGNSL